MGVAWNLDFTTESADAVDKSVGYLPEGWYRARLIAASDEMESGAKKLTFEVTYGPHTGRKFTETLNNPTLIDDTDKAKTALQRARIFGIRLGLIPRNTVGVVAPADYEMAVGREVVVRMKHRTFKGNDGQMKEFTGLDFSGIYEFEHPDVPKEVRPSLGLPPVPGATGSAPAGAPAGTVASAASPATAAANADAAAKSLFF
jgi:hypothetical protein